MKTRRLLIASCLLMTLAGAGASSAESWEAECGQPAVMPDIELVPAPIPQPGKWRGKGFGDKRKLDVTIEDCGQKIKGMIGVKLKHAITDMKTLERAPDGHYRAEFTYAESGMVARVTWDLEAESSSRVTGRMTIMGRADNVEADLLDPQPFPDMTNCECDLVRSRRGEIDRTLTERPGAGAAAMEAATVGWATDPETCSVSIGTADRSLPTQASIDALAQAGWEGEQVHRDRCCSVQQARAADPQSPSYSDWVRSAAVELAADEIIDLARQRAALDAWLEERCDGARGDGDGDGAK